MRPTLNAQVDAAMPRVNVLEMRSLRGRLRQDEHRRRRGLPSRAAEWSLVERAMELQLAKRQRGNAELQQRRKRYEFELMRSRVLERKRDALSAVRARRVVASRTCINQWKRQQHWLNEFESFQEQRSLEPHDDHAL